MLSAILLVNAHGDIIVSRFYRGDVTLASAKEFRLKVIAAKKTSSEPPIRLMNRSSYLYTRHGNIFFVAVARQNTNVAMAFHFLYQFIRILRAYFGVSFDEEALKQNFTLVYELMDEIMDYGYPQSCAIDVLRTFIKVGSISEEASVAEVKTLASTITGTIDWRKEGIKYRNNEVYIDVLESVNFLRSAHGNVLRSEVSGQIVMRTFLTGMPECKLGLNDKLLMDKRAGGRSGSSDSKKAAVELDDCTFHRCVRLHKFDADRTITFIPPDGEFELMRYRITRHVTQPFRVLPVYMEHGRSRLEITLKVVSIFPKQLFASNAIFKIPLPPNTAKAKINVSTGRARYDPGSDAILWRVRRFPGGVEYSLSANVTLMSTRTEKAWSKPPIDVNFQVPMFPASGIVVRFLQVFEKSAYQTKKWVRYITRAGQYQVRIPGAG